MSDEIQIKTALQVKENSLNEILNELQTVAKEDKNKQANNAYFRLLQMRKSYLSAKESGNLQSAVSIIGHLYTVAQKSLFRATHTDSTPPNTATATADNRDTASRSASAAVAVAEVDLQEISTQQAQAFAAHRPQNQNHTGSVGKSEAHSASPDSLDESAVNDASLSTQVLNGNSEAPAEARIAASQTNLKKRKPKKKKAKSKPSDHAGNHETTNADTVASGHVKRGTQFNIDAPEFQPSSIKPDSDTKRGTRNKGKGNKSNGSESKQHAGSHTQQRNKSTKHSADKSANGNKPMKQNKGDNAQKGNKSIKQKSNGKKNAKATPKRWWKIIDEMDPITMEPISDLRYPPFQLNSDSNDDSESGVVHYFDGVALAQYIVATGTFMNPNNRQPLTRETCRRLDQYLRDNRLSGASVTEAFDLSKVIEIANENGADEAARSRSNALRREATVLLGSLFQFQSYDGVAGSVGGHGRSTRGRGRNGAPRGSNVRSNRSSNNANNNQSSTATHHRGEDGVARTIVHQEGNLMVLDGDSWENIDNDGENFDFPAIDQANPVSAPRVAPAPTPEGSAGASLAARAAYTRQQTVPPTSSNVAFPPAGSSDHQPANAGRLNTSEAATIWRQSGSAVKRAPTAEERNRQIEQQRVQEQNWRVAAAAKKKAAEDSKLANSAFGTVSVAAPTSRSTAGLLCPYLPKQFRDAREFGLNWVSVLESKLFEFCAPGNTKKHLELGEMPANKRSFVHELCQHYWGMETYSLYQDPHRVICASKLATSRPPEITLLKALMDFPDAANEPWTATLSNIRQGNNSIGLWNAKGPGATRPTSSLVSNALSQFARSSEYHITYLNDHHVLLEFASHNRARRVHASLVATAGHLGALQFEKAQWWPCGGEWASRQLHIVDEAKREQQLAERQREQIRKQIEKNNAEKEKMSKMTDAWDDSDNEQQDDQFLQDGDNALLSLSHTQRMAYQVAHGESFSEKNAKKTRSKKTSAPPNPFGVLDEDSSSDEED